MEKPTALIESIAWPLTRLGELLEHLARESKLSQNPIELPQPKFKNEKLSPSELEDWIRAAADFLNVEVEPFNVFYDEVEKMVRNSAPAILRLPGYMEIDQPGLIALIKGGKNSVLILTPDLNKKRVKIELIRKIICDPYDVGIIDEINQLLDEADVDPEKRAV
ncbi:MAG: hypothetical protein ACK2TU_04160, partial [Anaerolineales bacterium]